MSAGVTTRGGSCDTETARSKWSRIRGMEGFNRVATVLCTGEVALAEAAIGARSGAVPRTSDTTPARTQRRPILLRYCSVGPPKLRLRYVVARRWTRVGSAIVVLAVVALALIALAVIGAVAFTLGLLIKVAVVLVLVVIVLRLIRRR